MIFAAFHDLSLGILLGGESRTITAEVTLTTAAGGLPKDFSSVKLAYLVTNNGLVFIGRIPLIPATFGIISQSVLIIGVASFQVIVL